MGRPKKNTPLPPVFPGKKVSSLPDMPDILTTENSLWDLVLKRASRFARVYGFNRIETPLVEDSRLYEQFLHAHPERLKDCQDVYDSNVPLIVENKNIIERIGLIMRTIGVPDSYTHSYYKTNNSRNKTTENKIAGWREDAARNIPTTNINIPDKKRLVQSVEEAYAKAIHAAGEAEREVKKKEEELLKQNELAMLRVKYTPDNALSDAWDILFKILKEDKYLCLAHYLQLNRGDWSDGYHYAETGIDDFSADSPEDKLIYKEITGLIENWDGDGRVFRDCKYNYDYLFNLVEDHLVKDYNIVCKYINFC
jgi:hypothetical protein